MSARGGRGSWGGWAPWVALGAAAIAAWLLVRHYRVEDRTELCRRFIGAVESWAKQQGMRPNEEGSRRGVRTEGRVRWMSFDLGYWHPPSRQTAALAGDLVRLAGSAGMRARATTGEAGARVVEFVFGDGRPAGRVWMRRECLVAIVIDDMGFNVAAAKRVIALPCAVTCAIIPFTAHGRAVAGLARAAGKEVYIHMPMESPFRAPDVPEYRCILRPGMSRAQVEEKVKLALSEVPRAAGMNNHEGSLATESPELMADLMAVLKPRRLVFMDSGTTEKTVAWKAAREAGVRWERRTVFLDAELVRVRGAANGAQSAGLVEAEFARLVSLARRRGHAIAIGHARFAATLGVLERRIPEARAQGVEFVPASWLAHPGKP